MHALARTARTALAAVALSGALAIAQNPPAPPASSASSPASTAAAPPPMHRMGPMPHGQMHGAAMQRGSFRGGPPQHFHGGPGGWETGGLRMGPGGMWWKNPRIAERLSLTADQTKKMDDIVEQSRLQLIDLRANLEKEQVRLSPLMDANPVNTAAASAQIDKVANARADLEKANAKMLLSIRGVLTPDQWTKLHERPTREAEPAAGAGPSAPGANAAPGGGHWRGGRSGGQAGPGGNGMDDVAPGVDAQ